ncbi:hypothetical protein [Mycolicibacter sinensis]
MATIRNAGDFTDEEAAAVGRVVLGLACQRIDWIDEDQAAQYGRLDEVRAATDKERTRALAAESWDDLCSTIKLFDVEHKYVGPDSLPGSDVEHVFGYRLAYDLIRCEYYTDVLDTLAAYSNLIKKPDHLVRIALVALAIIANDVVPQLLVCLEEGAGDYYSRVRLAEAALKAWEAQVGDRQEIRWWD